MNAHKLKLIPVLSALLVLQLLLALVLGLSNGVSVSTEEPSNLIPADISTVDRMKIEGGRKTKTGAWSTDSDVLEDVAAQGHPIATKVLEWRELSRLKSKLQGIDAAGRAKIHGHGKPA